jgi:hypothetical protein
VAVIITDDRQVMIWDAMDGSGERYSEHRSMGDMLRGGYFGTTGDLVWVRAPRAAIDPLFVVCCLRCSRYTGRLSDGKHRRAQIVSEHETEKAATRASRRHHHAHRMAEQSFLMQQIVVFKRQRRLERQLG